MSNSKARLNKNYSQSTYVHRMLLELNERNLVQKGCIADFTTALAMAGY